MPKDPDIKSSAKSKATAAQKTNAKKPTPAKKTSAKSKLSLKSVSFKEKLKKLGVDPKKTKKTIRKCFTSNRTKSNRIGFFGSSIRRVSKR